MPSTLKFAGMDVPVPGFGAMGMSFAYGKADDETSKKTLMHAIELGCTFWDTATIYGMGHNERLIGSVLASKPGLREKVFVASKCGMEIDEEKKSIGKLSNTPEHIKEYLANSTERLGFTPDLYYLHRIDPNVPIETSVATLEELRKAGKTKYIGLSECTVDTLRRACAVAKIDAIQVEYSPWETFVEGPGGLLETCKELDVAFIAYSPLGRGFLTGQIKSPDDLPKSDFRSMVPRFQKEVFEENMKIVHAIQKIADKKNCTPAQLSLAWVIAQGAIPIPGTRSIKNLDQNFDARNIELTEEDLKEMREVIDAGKPKGNRYPDQMMGTVAG